MEQEWKSFIRTGEDSHEDISPPVKTPKKFSVWDVELPPSWYEDED